MHELLLVLFFHVAAMLDVNKCSLDILTTFESAKNECVYLACETVVRNVVELKREQKLSQKMTSFIQFSSRSNVCLSQRGMVVVRRKIGYWKNLNNANYVISSILFHRIA